MNLIKKKRIISKLSTIATTITLFAMKSNICFATAIGTKEVDEATENIKRVIIRIAMPLRWCFNIC